MSFPANMLLVLCCASLPMGLFFAPRASVRQRAWATAPPLALLTGIVATLFGVFTFRLPPGDESQCGMPMVGVLVGGLVITTAVAGTSFLFGGLLRLVQWVGDRSKAPAPSAKKTGG